MRKIYSALTTWIALAIIGCLPFHANGANPETGKDKKGSDPVVIAYVTSWSHILPDPEVVTHINYAFGHITESFDGIGIANEKRLRTLTELKKQKPSLKILLSIGGWGSGRFSEMAATPENRKAFAADCKRVIREFNLDGVDIDWEYPTSKAGGISASPDDTRNYTLMMQEIRKAIGKKKLLTLASVASGKYIDFAGIEPFVDFVNIMTYDIASPPYHHASLFHSDMTRGVSCEEAVEAHVKAGMPVHRLALGIPFYGHGKEGIDDFINYKKIVGLIDNGTYKRKWDAQAKVPYLINKDGKMVCTYEDAESIRGKCRFIREKGMLGGMYWDYDGDDAQGTLRKAVYEGVTGDSLDK